MGWSNTAMARTYLHMTEQVRSDIAKRVDALIWGIPASADDDPDVGPEGALIPA